MRKRTLLSIMLVLPALCASAQSHLDASVSVEGKYLPDIIRMERVSTFPGALTTATPFEGLEYSMTGVTADFTPLSKPLSATEWGRLLNVSEQRGYVDISLGSWLNSNLSAGVSLFKNKKSSLSSRLQFNSTSLWKSKNLYRSLSQSGNRERYDGVIGLDFTHSLSDTQWLAADMQYHLGAFNYYGLGESQTLNDFAFRFGWNRSKGLDELNWNAGTALRYFGYRSGGYLADKGTRETDLNINGSVSLPWSNGSALSLDADMDLLFYADYYKSVPLYMISPEYMIGPDNYGLVSFTPAYSFARGKTFIRVGAVVDLAFNAGEKGNRYNLFHIAPDCRLMTDFGRVRLALDIDGGSELTTLSSLWGYDYYQSPVLLSSRPVYTPVDARLELSFVPFYGFSFSLNGEYKISRGIFMGGGYLPCLYSDFDPNKFRYNLHGFSAGVKIDWQPSKVFGMNLYASYQPQRGTLGFFNGYDRPKVVAGGVMNVQPVERFMLELSYELRAKRTFYCPYPQTLSNLSLLGAKATFNVTKRFYVGVQGCNLLNRRNILSPENPSEGIVILGNLGLTF